MNNNLLYSSYHQMEFVQKTSVQFTRLHLVNLINREFLVHPLHHRQLHSLQAFLKVALFCKIANLLAQFRVILNTMIHACYRQMLEPALIMYLGGSTIHKLASVNNSLMVLVVAIQTTSTKGAYVRRNVYKVTFECFYRDIYDPTESFAAQSYNRKNS